MQLTQSLMDEHFKMIADRDAEITRLKEDLTAFKESHEELHSKFHECIKEITRLKGLVREMGEDMNRQEGGDHYLRLPIQPWEIIERCNLDFFEGNVIKYILRRKDDRLTDLKKARHYLDHLIEREEVLQDKH